MQISISDVHSMLLQGERKLTDFYARILEDIKKYPSVFISESPAEKVMASAEEAQAVFDSAGRIPEGKPLLGIPWVVKDNIDVAGMTTTAGCPEYAYFPNESAEVYRLLEEAGAILIGKTNMDQFATGLVGVRSPYGIPENSCNGDYIPGGSSSGSAVAVARGLCCFSLGTDTAGSGRVPAAMNGIFGYKPTRGLFSTRGVVPACRSLDCVSVFVSRSEDLPVIYEVLSKPDREDPFSRPIQCDGKSRNTGNTIAVPISGQLDFMDSPESESIWNGLLEQFRNCGYTVRKIDFRPFLDAAKLLYEGPWIAERYAYLGEFVRTHKGAVNEITAGILENGGQYSASDYFSALWTLQEYRKRIESLMEANDFFVTPTIPRAVTLEEVKNEPVLKNTQLGYYTNFMNLLDLCAVAVPFGEYKNRVPWGYTVFADRFADTKLFDFVGRSNDEKKAYVPIAVCGAHMSGLPLNHQLISIGGRFLNEEATAPHYKMYSLNGEVEKPGLVRTREGVSFPLEIWNIPETELFGFMRQIPAPLGLGEVELINGSWITGFICGMENAGEDISSYGGWRSYLECASAT